MEIFEFSKCIDGGLDICNVYTGCHVICSGVMLVYIQ